MTHNSRNQRRFFRLAYPLSDRPKLTIDYRSFEVSELSEQGLRFFLRNAPELFAPSAVIEGELAFQDGNVASISGTVGRMTDADVVLLNLSGVSFARMVKEQRHLIRKYGNFMKK